MAHFARLKNNVVIDVVVVSDKELNDGSNGILFCQSLWGNEFEYVRTHYNSNDYARIGFIYNGSGFVPPG